MNSAHKSRSKRIGTLTFVLAGLFVLAIVRMVALIILDGSKLNSMARSEHTSELELAALRGPILDRHGEPLALCAETRSIYARPRKLLAASTPATRAKLASALAITPAELDRALAKPAPFIWLQRRVDPARAQAVDAIGLDGVGSISEYKRFYPESGLAGAVIGSAGMDGQGLSGVELEYDGMIRGKPLVVSLYHDAMGHPIVDDPVELRTSQPGAQVELTIDARIQSLAEKELADEVGASGAKHGAAIVLDPFSGEVLALANVNATPDPVHDRLHNAAVQDAFEPGSTMKGLLASIALGNKAVNTSEHIYCENGAYHFDKRTIHDDSPHGSLDLAGIIEVSSNIGAAKIALRLGAPRFYDGLVGFGLGRRTGIDLTGEATGLLRKPATWRGIDLANHGFGQGIAVTPIQLAVAYAAIANGGLVVRPHVVRTVRDAEGNPIITHTPQIVGRAISPSVAHTMNVILRGPVNGPDGTAHRAQVENFIVAGKTGTAQMVNPATGGYFQNRHVASFVGFLPADDPKLLILVVLYDVGHAHFGGVIAAPVFREIASGAVRDLDIASSAPAPSYDEASMLPIDKIFAHADAADTKSAGATNDADVKIIHGKTPDFRSMSLRRAFETARAIGANLDIKGEGYVVAQDPAAGMPMASAPIKLTFAENGAQSSSQSSSRTRSNGRGSPR